MEKKTIYLREEVNRQFALNFIQALHFNNESPIEITIKPYKKNRSLEQNALYWKWCAIIGNETGYSKDDMHWFFMNTFLEPELIEINGKVIERLSTSKLKVSEMSHYLSQISAWAAQAGMTMPSME